jgi:hypothetical protein
MLGDGAANIVPGGAGGRRRRDPAELFSHARPRPKNVAGAVLRKIVAIPDHARGTPCATMEAVIGPRAASIVNIGEAAPPRRLSYQTTRMHLADPPQ